MGMLHPAPLRTGDPGPTRARRGLLCAVLVGSLATTAACGSTVQTGDQAPGTTPVAGQQLPGDSLGGVPNGDTVVPGTTDPGGSLPDGTDPGGTVGGTGSGGGAPSDPGAPGSPSDPGITAPGGGDGTNGSGTPDTPSGGDLAANAPVEIGFLSTATSNAAALGFGSGASYADTDMYAALVTEYNATGGLAGHKIKAVLAKTDTGANNWSNDFQAACSTFTEDNKVNAVVGYQFIYYDAFEACLAKAGVAHFYGGYQPGDAVSQQQLPNLISTGSPTVDGADLTALTGARKAGLLGAGKTVGILVNSCAHGDRAFKNTTEPWLKANKIDYEVGSLTCPSGSGDAGSAAAAISGAELRFAASGVDVVYAYDVALLLFMIQAETQGYRPKYVSGAGANAVVSMAPRNQAQNVNGFGWSPSSDVALTRQPYARTPAQTACLGKLAKHGVVPRQFNDFTQAYLTCDGLELYARALAAAKTLDARAVVAAAEASLPKFRGAATYGGAVRSAAGQRGGPATFRRATFDSGCTCMVYTGQTYSVPLP